MRTPASTTTPLNILKLLTGRITAQLFGFVIVPILSRIFLPEHFGALQIFTAISAILIPVASLKYELAIPLAKDDEDAMLSLILNIVILAGITLSILTVVSIGRVQIAARFKLPQLERFLWLLPLAVGIHGLKNALTYWAARAGAFGVIAWTELSLSTSDKLIALLWGSLIGASATGLFAGHLGSAGISVGLLGIGLRKRIVFHASPRFAMVSRVWSLAQRHKKFPLFSSSGVFANAISMQLPSLILGSYFSPAVVGYYALGHNTINLSMNMVNNSIAQVFFPLAAQEYNEQGSLRKIVNTFLTRLIQVSIFPMMIIGFLGPLLFQLVFGKQWAEAGVYAQILAIWWFFAFINFPLRVFEIVDHQEIGLAINIGMLFIRAISLVLGATFTSPRITLALFAVSSACCLFGSLMWKLKISNVSILNAVRTLFRYLILSVGLLLPVKLVAGYIPDFRIIVGLTGCATLGYGMALLKIDPTFREFFLTLLNKPEPIDLR